MKNQNDINTIKIHISKPETFNGVVPKKVEFQLLNGKIESENVFLFSDYPVGDLVLAKFIDKYKFTFNNDYKSNDYISEENLNKKTKALFELDDPDFKSTTIKLERINESVFNWIKRFQGSYKIDNLSSMKHEMRIYLDELNRIKDNSSLKVLFKSLCLYYLNKKLDAKNIIKKALGEGKFNNNFKALAENLLIITSANCKKRKNNHSIAFITSVRSVESDSRLVRLIISSSKEYLGDKFCVNQFDSRQYINISELLTHLSNNKKFQHIIFIGHASRNEHRFVFRNCFNQREELSNDDFNKFTSFLEQNEDSSIFMFTCDGERYKQSISNKCNFIYTKDSSNNPEEEIYCGGFFQAFGCGNNLLQSHEAGKLALVFRSTNPITCDIRPKSNKTNRQLMFF